MHYLGFKKPSWGGKVTYIILETMKKNLQIVKMDIKNKNGYIERKVDKISPSRLSCLTYLERRFL